MTGIDRRAFLLTASASAFALPGSAAAAPVIPLWPGRPPGGGGPSGPERIDHRGFVSNVSRPCLRMFVPERPNGAAMLVAGGGGYLGIQSTREEYDPALWLTARGITAFTLTYRLPGEGWGAGAFAPFQDAQRALRLIRATLAGRLRHLGVLGFSAGGHLMGMAAMRPDFPFYPPVDATDEASARPDAAALIYPVITLEPPYDHFAFQHLLIGEHPTLRTKSEWSVQNYVRPGAPPVFLVQALDDPNVSPANTEIMAAACHKAGVPVTLRQLQEGGHGFGMGRAGDPTGLWPGWFASWLQVQEFASARQPPL